MIVSERIGQFLRDHPAGRLIVVVGYASPAGLAWLEPRTQGRPVSLLVGNTQKRYWSNFSMEDAETAMRFLSRPDVKVRNWYRSRRAKEGPAMVHMKAWVVESDGVPVAALVGSANLTKNGLEANVEIMVEATGDDLIRTWGEVRGLHEKGWDSSDRLAGYMSAEPGAGPQDPKAEADEVQAEPTGVEAASSGESWKPDPTGRNHYRWWDGSRWTSYVANEGRMTADPVSRGDIGGRKETTTRHVRTTGTIGFLDPPPRDRRAAEFLLECLLFFVTLVIGWAIWSLVAYGQGQTPAKQILKMRVVRVSDGSTASGWRMAVREIFFKSGFWFAFLVATPFPSVAAIFFGLACIWLLTGWVVAVRDPAGRTLWDKMLGTVVVTKTAQN
ncbi:RDD family protein [Candidatus Poriferisocius sp.]|uniref:RDD family protein n=1 Tax=Candidatus Poriferisocius sp. TaxID=3101276 RepID=UPI003B029D17